MDSETFNFVATVEDSGLRLDQLLAKHCPQFSRAYLTEQIKSGRVVVNNKPVLKAKTLIKGFERITLTVVQTNHLSNEADASVELPIAYEDDELLIINKPAGLIVHPGAGNPNKTLVNGILSHLPNNASLPRAGLIHRLDKDTSGLLMVAKTLCAHTFLVKALERREISRRYLALINGLIIESASIETNISRNSRNRLKMAVTDTGKKAITHYSPIEQFEHHTLLEVKLETGRTHQIRVHLSHLNYPIVGDALYGGYQYKKKSFSPSLQETLEGFRRQALHAYQLELTHPKTQKLVAFKAPIPEDMQTLLSVLRHESQMDLG